MSQNDSDDFRSVLYSVDREGHRKWLYVDIVQGAWRSRRRLVAYILIVFYLALPFLTINGNPLLRIDIPSRTYTLMGQIFWPQDFAYALLFVLLGIIGTLLMVSLCGRVFCGWVCPHNVFLEMVFRPIERWIEGPAHRHRLSDKKGEGDGRFMRKTIKIIIYLIIAGALANAATAIFVGKESFIGGVLLNPIEHPYAAIFFAMFYGAIVFNFVWFREQTCTLVCPYGRLQTAMLDRETLVVAYDKNRGEPRGRKGSVEGDCVDCERCIQVCPTGIDIRNGNQLECIHCSACIDACNDVMGRLDRAPDLIKYASEASLAGERQRILRPRTILYGVVFMVILVVSVYLLATRSLIDIVHLRQRIAPQLIMLDGTEYIQASVPMSFVNKSKQEKDLHFALPEGLDAELVTQFNPLQLEGHKHLEQIFYIRIPLTSFTKQSLKFDLATSVDGEVIDHMNVRVRRPMQQVKE